MSPTKLPTAPRKSWTASRRSLFRNPLGAAAAISFSLTFVGAGIALLLGYLPAGTIIGASEVDTGVVLLFVPLCALILAILVEVTRSSLRDGFASDKPRRPNALAAWKPGHGEG
jgi:hypothetical protein